MRDSVWPPRRGDGRVHEWDQQRSETADQLPIAVAKSDEIAFERRYPLVAGAVLGVVHQVTGDRAQAKEVSQDVPVQLWSTAAGYGPSKCSAATWALTVARRRAVDRVRAARAPGVREESFGVDSVEHELDEVSEAMTSAREREQTRRCLSSLTTTQRESVELAYYGGRTYLEVAELLNTPLGTIKSRQRDALIRLLDSLAAA